MNVFVLKNTPQYGFRKNDKSNFIPLIDSKEKEAIITFTKKTNKLFNGSVVRLDNVQMSEDNSLVYSISPLTYFDSLTTTMLYHKYHDKLEQLGDNDTENDIKRIVNKISEAGVTGFSDIINNNYLANTIAVSVMIKDINNDYCMVRRKKDLNIGAGLLSVTVTGAVDDIDFEAEDPIISCAKRELMEELSIHCDNLSFDYIAISKTKLQPIAIVNGCINDKWKNITNDFSKATDFSNEINGYFIVPKEKVKEFAQSSEMTDAACFHITSIIENQ